MNRLARLQALQMSVDQYVASEQTRIMNEVTALQAILNGRTGGAGVQQSSSAAVTSVAYANIASYLES